MRQWLLIFALVFLVAVARAEPAHWASVAPTTQSVPQNASDTWSRSPLDRFIFAKAAAAGLEPADEADRRTLIRRATFDLTGLPPTPAAVEAFVADATPDAYDKLIDRLLASPEYGEKWGRHWLDLARYADSNGLDENYAYANAWRYRDYVIASFNSDKPYDQFLMEQIAGDLIPPFDHSAKRNEHLVATGFLALGPKVLSEPDAKKMEMDVIDEQVDTLGRAILGMTFGCARCHDHKFDPISQEDYYGLAGIFTSTRTMARYQRPSVWHENWLGTPEENAKAEAHDAKMRTVLAAIDDAASREDRAEVKRLRAQLTKLGKEAPGTVSALGVEEGDIADTPVLARGDFLMPGKVVPRRFPCAIAGAEQQPLPKDQSGRLQLAKWLVGPNNPLTARVMVNRIWRWHFGRGIVATPDNFGLLGEKPTHPELLDWLARRFVESGWSIKAMHRLIMRSATYRTGISLDRHADQIDPENRLYARHTPRRLEAEEFRDAILFVSGTLDRSARGGPSLTNVKNRERVFDILSVDKTTYDTRKRSIYLPIVRNHMFEMFPLFDCPDACVPNGDRASTTVAPQALFALNSELMLSASESMAKGLLAENDSDESRVQHVYSRCYGRPAGKAELRRALSLVADFQSKSDREKAWSYFCQTILASNEFVYVN